MLWACSCVAKGKVKRYYRVTGPSDQSISKHSSCDGPGRLYFPSACSVLSGRRPTVPGLSAPRIKHLTVAVTVNCGSVAVGAQWNGSWSN